MKHILPLLFFFLTINLSAQLREFQITERKADGTSVVESNTEYPYTAYFNFQDLDCYFRIKRWFCCGCCLN